jgi:hypothetical protein
MGFLDDTPREYLQSGSTIKWVEATAQHIGAEPTEAYVQSFLALS